MSRRGLLTPADARWSMCPELTVLMAWDMYGTEPDPVAYYLTHAIVEGL